MEGIFFTSDGTDFLYMKPLLSKGVKLSQLQACGKKTVFNRINKYKFKDFLVNWFVDRFLNTGKTNLFSELLCLFSEADIGEELNNVVYRPVRSIWHRGRQSLG